MVKRPASVPPPVADRIDQYVSSVEERLCSSRETSKVVQEILARLHGDGDLYDRWRAGESVTQPEQLRLDAYHPRNALTQADEWAEKDEETFRESKALGWLWHGFDASVLSDNLALAFPFRQMLADHLFAEAGDDLRLFGGITFPYGHNIEIGDRTVVHEEAVLDDRGKLAIGSGVSIADGAALHSHRHDIVEQDDVSIYRTVVEDDVRLGSEAAVAAGCRIGRNAMVGTRAVVRGDVPAHHVAVGIPAESVRVKPGWQSVAEEPGSLEVNREDRRIEYELPEEVDTVEEFGRDLEPPDQTEG